MQCKFSIPEFTSICVCMYGWGRATSCTATSCTAKSTHAGLDFCALSSGRRLMAPLSAHQACSPAEDLQTSQGEREQETSFMGGRGMLVISLISIWLLSIFLAGVLFWVHRCGYKVPVNLSINRRHWHNPRHLGVYSGEE